MIRTDKLSRDHGIVGTAFNTVCDFLGPLSPLERWQAIVRLSQPPTAPIVGQPADRSVGQRVPARSASASRHPRAGVDASTFAAIHDVAFLDSEIVISIGPIMGRAFARADTEGRLTELKLPNKATYGNIWFELLGEQPYTLWTGTEWRTVTGFYAAHWPTRGPQSPIGDWSNVPADALIQRPEMIATSFWRFCIWAPGPKHALADDALWCFGLRGDIEHGIDEEIVNIHRRTPLKGASSYDLPEGALAGHYTDLVCNLARLAFNTLLYIQSPRPLLELQDTQRPDTLNKLQRKQLKGREKKAQKAGRHVARRRIWAIAPSNQRTRTSTAGNTDGSSERALAEHWVNPHWRRYWVGAKHPDWSFAEPSRENAHGRRPLRIWVGGDTQGYSRGNRPPDRVIYDIEGGR